MRSSSDPAKGSIPHVSPHVFLQLLERAPPRTPLNKALMGILPGAGPFLVREIALRAGADPTAALLDAPRQQVVAASGDIYSSVRDTRMGAVCVRGRTR